jgi:hypothetical protein
MTDYETLMWPRSALFETANVADVGDDDEASLRDLLWQYANDSRTPRSESLGNDDDDDDDNGPYGSALLIERHRTIGQGFVALDTDDDDDDVEGDDYDDDDGMIRDDGGDSVIDSNGAVPDVFLRMHEDRDIVAVFSSGRNDVDGDDNEQNGDDAQRAFADQLASALGDVDEVHLHGDGSVVLRKERRLPVALMGGVVAPGKIVDATLTIAQADDGVTVLLGEVALLGDEVGAAERALLAEDAGAVVTALHNHWVSEPTIYYLYFQALTHDPETFLAAVAPWWRSL